MAGASGGVKYVCSVTNDMREEFVSNLCDILREKERVIIGDFLYMTDILYDPDIISKAGHILASIFIEKDIDYVVTVETKGIPLAYEVAKMLGVKLVIVRRDNKVTEGTTIDPDLANTTAIEVDNFDTYEEAVYPVKNEKEEPAQIKVEYADDAALDALKTMWADIYQAVLDGKQYSDLIDKLIEYAEERMK